MPAAGSGSSLCSSLMLFQMFPQLPPCGGHVACASPLLQNGCVTPEDTRALSRAVLPAVLRCPCLMPIKMFNCSFPQFLGQLQRCT